MLLTIMILLWNVTAGRSLKKIGLEKISKNEKFGYLCAVISRVSLCGGLVWISYIWLPSYLIIYGSGFGIVCLIQIFGCFDRSRYIKPMKMKMMRV